MNLLSHHTWFGSQWYNWRRAIHTPLVRKKALYEFLNLNHLKQKSLRLYWSLFFIFQVQEIEIQCRLPIPYVLCVPGRKQHKERCTPQKWKMSQTLLDKVWSQLWKRRWKYQDRVHCSRRPIIFLEVCCRVLNGRKNRTRMYLDPQGNPYVFSLQLVLEYRKDNFSEKQKPMKRFQTLTDLSLTTLEVHFRGPLLLMKLSVRRMPIQTAGMRLFWLPEFIFRKIIGLVAEVISVFESISMCHEMIGQWKHSLIVILHYRRSRLSFDWAQWQLR